LGEILLEPFYIMGCEQRDRMWVGGCQVQHEINFPPDEFKKVTTTLETWGRQRHPLKDRVRGKGVLMPTFWASDRDWSCLYKDGF
jgi:hypothetical protein